MLSEGRNIWRSSVKQILSSFAKEKTFASSRSFCLKIREKDRTRKRSWLRFKENFLFSLFALLKESEMENIFGCIVGSGQKDLHVVIKTLYFGSHIDISSFRKLLLY